jgi:hypothetical protein
MASIIEVLSHTVDQQFVVVCVSQVGLMTLLYMTNELCHAGSYVDVYLICLPGCCTTAVLPPRGLGPLIEMLPCSLYNSSLICFGHLTCRSATKQVFNQEKIFP